MFPGQRVVCEWSGNVSLVSHRQWQPLTPSMRVSGRMEFGHSTSEYDPQRDDVL